MPSRRQKGIPPVSETRDGPAISADSSTPLYKDHSESADSQTPLDPEKPSHDDTCSALLALLCCRNSSTGENVERVVFINDQERNKELGYVDNTISNTKYTVLNFIPKNLAEQFSHHINRYFLIIACLQLWSEITPVNPATTWVPLIIIFTITAVKELLDDLGRRGEDREANSRTYTLLRDGKEKRVQSCEIQVGDIVKLFEDDEIPADCVLLNSSDPQGLCYIQLQTTNLDGESNLKTRTSLSVTNSIEPKEQLSNFEGTILCQSPGDAGFDNLEKFDAALKTEAQDNGIPLSLSSEQLLLQATNVRNTQYAYAVVVYTGNETKFGKNKRIPPTKYTKTDTLINEFAGLIFVFQLAIVFILGIAGNMWKEDKGRGKFYLNYSSSSDEPWYQPLIIPLRFLLLNSTMIPISLKVTMDLCKLYYSKFINADLLLYDEDSDRPAHANSTALAEDLGQVEYILSDKTGTLTENVMLFKACTIRGIEYGACSDPCDDSKDEGLNEEGLMEDPIFRRAVREEIKENSNECNWHLEFLRSVALNNTVNPTQQCGTLARQYKASSPDEEALVDGVSRYGVALIARDQYTATIMVPSKNAPLKGIDLSRGEYATVLSSDVQLSNTAKEQVRFETWDVLETFEFTSDRKRMSVLVRDPNTGQLCLYTKGADDVILARLSEDESKSSIRAKLGSQIDSFAVAGLRTLVMAFRHVPEGTYQKWKKEFDEANSLRFGRDEAKEICYDKLEKDLTILGATGIEDKLQNGVPDTIAQLRRAGIKVWMCTGDKYTTAKTISYTCKLCDSATTLLSVDGETADEVGYSLAENINYLKDEGFRLIGLPPPINGPFASFRKNTGICVPREYRSQPSGAAVSPRASGSSSQRKQFAVIIRGSTLRVALEHHKENFGKISMSANTVICCRVNPRQKAQLVGIVRNAHHTALSVGDGGNDVSMIQEAQVGVGIRGKEGLQAARASDYQISYFRDLLRLILIHGRYSYYRTSYVAQYSFYKSFVFCFMQIGYAFASGFSGVSLFNSLSVAAYNAVLFVPIVFFFLDKDINERTALSKPEAYSVCRRGELMNYGTMISWFNRAVFQATMLLIIGLLFPAPGSDLFQYEVLGLVIFVGYLWVQDFTMLFELRRITVHNVVSIFGLHLIAIGVGLGWNYFQSPMFWDFLDYYTMTKALGNGVTWLVHLLMTIVCIVPVEAWKSWKFRFKTSFYSELIMYDARMGNQSVDWSKRRTTQVRNSSFKMVKSANKPLSVTMGNQDNGPKFTTAPQTDGTTDPGKGANQQGLTSKTRHFSVVNKQFAGIAARQRNRKGSNFQHRKKGRLSNAQMRAGSTGERKSTDSEPKEIAYYPNPLQITQNDPAG